ncbi:FMN-dependent NADH-azoreductase [Nocardia sp. XZ_19_385]|uniref:FMN-dependent NADH-azoreductase n=1 Tax=Nocardia sp. XZ_19_385 TaxID=2769488 RepID=UPI00188E52A2|nr:NAD(P)H-dependent oxidoreductase [Nocardia sp. XZ_19_385]
MTKLLHLDASPRGARSHTRSLTGDFVTRWVRQRSDVSVARRDLGCQPPPHLTEGWIAAAFTKPEERTPQMLADLALSDELVDELLGTDVLVVGVPMYNFGIPAMLKAYIDQIVRVGRTFSFDPELADPYAPLLPPGKRAFFIVSTGDSGYQPDGPLAGLNQVEPYLRTVFGFIGIEDLQFVYVGNDEFGGERLSESLAAARDRVAELTA